jgi:hypothetical protein
VVSRHIIVVPVAASLIENALPGNIAIGMTEVHLPARCVTGTIMLHKASSAGT